jgi:CTP synthase
MVGSQFHPELRSRPNRPHPLFVGFMGASLAQQQLKRTPPVTAEPHSSRRVSRTARAR